LKSGKADNVEVGKLEALDYSSRGSLVGEAEDELFELRLLTLRFDENAAC
jgi:hypothetical protein